MRATRASLNVRPRQTIEEQLPWAAYCGWRSYVDRRQNPGVPHHYTRSLVKILVRYCT